MEEIILGFVKGLSIYDRLLMSWRLHRLGCFFVPPKFESYKQEHQTHWKQFEQKDGSKSFSIQNYV